MTGVEKDGAAVRVPPPLIPVAAVFAAVIADRRVFELPLDFAGGLRRPLAVALLVAGAGLIVGAMVLFHRTGQNPEPWKSTPELIPAGVYRLSRNPMYLGMAVLQGGAGVWYSNGWFLVLLPLTLLGMYYVAVRHEEAYLERKFGDSYRGYRAAVRRWL